MAAVSPFAEAPNQPARTSVRPSFMASATADRLLIVASVLLPVLLMAAIAGNTHRQVIEAGQFRVDRGVEIYRQHAINVFQTHELVATTVGERIRDLTWAEIARSGDLREYLRRLRAQYPQVHGIWLADGEGRVRNATEDLPPTPVSVADRDYFQALRARDTGTFIGQLVDGRVIRGLTFNLVRRRPSGDGQFDGVIVVGVYPAHFSEFWGGALADDGSVALLRGDRRLLARAPLLDPRRLSLDADSAFARAIQSSPDGFYRGVSTVDGVERLYSFRKVGRYDAYVVHGVSVQALFRDWRASMAVYGIFILAGGAGLLYLALRVKRTADREREARMRVDEAARQLETANKELEAFSYSVSHDLRAPLRAIDGFSEALAEDYPDKLDERGRDYLARVRAAAQRMARLIDDILRLSRVGRASMLAEQVDLGTLARAVDDELRETHPGRRVALVIGRDLTARGDAALLRVVLENLLGNAWKFTGKRADARIEVGSEGRAGEKAFFVRDNGAGFNPRYQDRLFGPFQRLHSEQEFPGTGIGLATVKRIISRHGGRVWAEGAEGKGASFYFTLPDRDQSSP